MLYMAQCSAILDYFRVSGASQNPKKCYFGICGSDLLPDNAFLAEESIGTNKKKRSHAEEEEAAQAESQDSVRLGRSGVEVLKACSASWSKRLLTLPLASQPGLTNCPGGKEGPEKTGSDEPKSATYRLLTQQLPVLRGSLPGFLKGFERNDRLVCAAPHRGLGWEQLLRLKHLWTLHVDANVLGLGLSLYAFRSPSFSQDSASGQKPSWLQNLVPIRTKPMSVNQYFRRSKKIARSRTRLTWCKRSCWSPMPAAAEASASCSGNLNGAKELANGAARSHELL